MSTGKVRPPFKHLIYAALVLLTTACGNDWQGETSQPTISNQDSRMLHPQDPAIADLYHRSCKNCHTHSATGAPLTGDTVAWKQRLDKGMETILDNVTNGYGGMPPLGLCMQCSPDELEALINFMASPPN